MVKDVARKDFGGYWISGFFIEFGPYFMHFGGFITVTDLFESEPLNSLNTPISRHSK